MTLILGFFFGIGFLVLLTQFPLIIIPALIILFAWAFSRSGSPGGYSGGSVHSSSPGRYVPRSRRSSGRSRAGSPPSRTSGGSSGSVAQRVARNGISLAGSRNKSSAPRGSTRSSSRSSRSFGGGSSRGGGSGRKF